MGNIKIFLKRATGILLILCLLAGLQTGLTVNAANATTLTLETANNLEADMDSGAEASWIEDNLLKEAAITVSSESSANAYNQYKANMYDGESSNEWQVGETGTSTPSVPKVVADFAAPGKTVKQIVLANDNNYGRYISEARITLTDNDGNTYTYTAGGIDRGGIPKAYTFSNAVNNVVKVEILTTSQGSQPNSGLANGFSYVGILDKRYSFTDLKLYYAKNAKGPVSVLEDTDGLTGVFIPSTAATGNAYALTNTGPFTLRRPRLTAGSYKITLYAKLYTPVVANADTTILKFKYAGQSIDVTGSDFSETDKYVKIEKSMTLSADQNDDLLIEYQAGSGSLKLDKFYIGPSGSPTPSVVQPQTSVIDPSTDFLTENPGVTGDGFDPDSGKTWLTANLLGATGATVKMNNADAPALFDRNEAVECYAYSAAAATVTATFSDSALPTLKRVILVSRYNNSNTIGSAKITVTDSANVTKTFTADDLKGSGSANTFTFSNPMQNVKTVTIEAQNITGTFPGWAEVALLDKRYDYEQNYLRTYSAAEAKWDQGIIDPPTDQNEHDNPESDWPRGTVNNNSAGTMMFVGTPSDPVALPAGKYKVVVYAKVLKPALLSLSSNLFRIHFYSSPSHIFSDVKGTDFAVNNEYVKISRTITLQSSYKDRVEIWNNLSGSTSDALKGFKIYSVSFSSENMESRVPNPMIDGTNQEIPIKVACVGDSITNGTGSSSSAHTYPAQLKSMLGSNYNVVNFGIGGKTLLTQPDVAYISTSNYTNSLSFLPDVVIIMLGTNDSKPANWQYKDAFVSDYVNLINSYKNLSSRPKVFLATSPTVASSNFNITDAVVTNEIVPLQKQVAELTGCPVFDINALTKNIPNIYADGVHLNDAGYTLIANTFAEIATMYKKCDLTGDDNVSIADLIRLKKYLLNSANVPVVLNPDINRDGFENALDLAQLRKTLLTP